MKKIILSIALVACMGLTSCGSGGEKTANENAEKTADASKDANKKEPEKVEETDKTEAPTKPSAEGLKIAKKWKMVKFTHTDGKEEKEPEKNSVKILNLKDDGTFEQLMNDKVINAGNWKLDGKSIVLKKAGASGAEVKEEKLNVKSSNDKQLVTVDDDGKMTETFEVVK
ncbi:MAG: hypothetical protein EAZ85_00635 [Bacteroidetes bacterium]|nr:MAG: hypothetical protein EAZ85_00635 [Bacteroidota bacterium]TAG85630.1 MAG: hypothetical protein EAZ20_14615 [Bacteroidota bacterium]